MCVCVSPMLTIDDTGEGVCECVSPMLTIDDMGEGVCVSLLC